MQGLTRSLNIIFNFSANSFITFVFRPAYLYAIIHARDTAPWETMKAIIGHRFGMFELGGIDENVRIVSAADQRCFCLHPC